MMSTCYDLPEEDRIRAAAPDLLEACEELVMLVQLWQDGIFKNLGITWSDDPPAKRKGLAAIAKAKGVK